MAPDQRFERPMTVGEQLDNWFTYHPPTPDEAERYGKLRAAGKQLAQTIADLCPESADRSAAFRYIREAVYSANASIACGAK
jgi:hypothetical protein